MTEKEMYEKSFQRPSNFFKLSEAEQFEIDKKLGVLDWMGTGLSKEEISKFKAHYKND